MKLGREAALAGYAAARAAGEKAYNATAGGIEFRIFIDPKTGLVTNFFPK